MTTVFISNATGGRANADAVEPDISADGRLIVFESQASDYVAGDTNGLRDIFLHDTETGTTTIISKAADGTSNSAGGRHPEISADGQFIVFESSSNNLVDNDTNIKRDIFLHNRITGETTLVSKATDGTQGNGGSFSATISADGKFIAYSSDATNLVANDTNGSRDVFLYDVENGTTTLVGVDSNGNQASESDGASLSADGSLVSFLSFDSSLIPGESGFTGNVFVHNTNTGETNRASQSEAGTGTNSSSKQATLSNDGQFIVFESKAVTFLSDDPNEWATDAFTDVFRKDLSTGEIIQVSLQADGSHPGGTSELADISGDGRYVVYNDAAGDVIPGDNNRTSDVLVLDTHTGQRALVSVASDGTQGDQFVVDSAISADGSRIVFTTRASNLDGQSGTSPVTKIFYTDNPIYDYFNAYLLGDFTQNNEGWHLGWYNGWGVGWHTAWQVGWNLGWYNGWGVGWHNPGTGWVVGWNVGWHFGWNVGWFFGWTVGWNVGWHFGWTFGQFETQEFGWHYGVHPDAPMGMSGGMEMNMDTGADPG
ncbi:MAG: hypothetical protein AAGK38_01040 [Pseudomonadota bacterium]